MSYGEAKPQFPRRIHYIIKAVPDSVDDIVKVHGITLNLAVGTIHWIPDGARIPKGWLLTNGALVGCIAYPELHAVIGDQYGNHPEIEVDAPIGALEEFLREHCSSFINFKPRKKRKIANPAYSPGMFALPDTRGQLLVQHKHR